MASAAIKSCRQWRVAGINFDVAPIPIRRAEDADTSSTEIGALDRERGGRSPMGASSSLAGTELRPHHCRASSQLFAFML
jgi:hypothetical protein